jgi:hypothetical protein
MDFQVQWFGLVLSLTSLLSAVGVLALLGVALVPVRKVDGGAGALLALAALLEGATIFLEWLGAAVNSLFGYGFVQLWNVVSALRPLAHLLVLLLVAGAVLRLARRVRS